MYSARKCDPEYPRSLIAAFYIISSAITDSLVPCKLLYQALFSCVCFLLSCKNHAAAFDCSTTIAPKLGSLSEIHTSFHASAVLSSHAICRRDIVLAIFEKVPTDVFMKLAHTTETVNQQRISQKIHLRDRISTVTQLFSHAGALSPTAPQIHSSKLSPS